MMEKFEEVICPPENMVTAGVALAVSGEWAGWVFIRHPDGNWVSAGKTDMLTMRRRYPPPSRLECQEAEEKRVKALPLLDVVPLLKPVPPVPTIPPGVTLTDGSPVTPEHLQINPETGMQKGYVVLSEEERAKGFVRPLRTFYIHEPCGTTTRMHQAIAETYARMPEYYGGTYCSHCKGHFPVGALGQFKWEDGTKVGT